MRFLQAVLNPLSEEPRPAAYFSEVYLYNGFCSGFKPQPFPTISRGWAVGKSTMQSKSPAL
jgi:hypothetical protein